MQLRCLKNDFFFFFFNNLDMCHTVSWTQCTSHNTHQVVCVCVCVEGNVKHKEALYSACYEENFSM